MAIELYKGNIVKMYKDKIGNACVVMLDSEGGYGNVTSWRDMWLMLNKVVLSVNQYP